SASECSSQDSLSSLGLKTSAAKEPCAFGQPHLQSVTEPGHHAAIASKEMSDGQRTAAGPGAGGQVAADSGGAGQKRPEHSRVLSAGAPARVGVLRLAANDPAARCPGSGRP